MSVLTFDKPPLSELTNEADQDEFAINCTYETVHAYVRDSISSNTRRAYASDLTRFTSWGGKLPADPQTIAAYLADHAETHASSTLRRWLSSLAKAHRAAGHDDPTKIELVHSVLRGIRRSHGSEQRQAKPLLRDDLLLALDCLESGIADVRDKALLLVGFAGGFRRSELVGLDFADVEPVRQGIVLRLRRGKTDQLGKGRSIGIPHGRSRHCPVLALDTWLARSAIASGPLFRPISRHGHVAGPRLSGEAVSIILRKRLAAAGFESDGYSGHSLRAGFATSAAQAGISSHKIRQQTGHASDAMLTRYIRSGELFVDNAAGALL